jgi:hypothetical protein
MTEEEDAGEEAGGRRQAAGGGQEEDEAEARGEGFGAREARVAKRVS